MSYFTSKGIVSSELISCHMSSTFQKSTKCFFARRPNFFYSKKNKHLSISWGFFFPQNVLIDTQNDALKTLSSCSRCTVCKKKHFRQKFVFPRKILLTQWMLFSKRKQNACCQMADNLYPTTEKKYPASAFEKYFSQKILMDTYFALQRAEAKSLCRWSKLMFLIIRNIKKTTSLLETFSPNF